MSASAAFWSTPFSDLLSMAAMISASTPCLISSSICATWVFGLSCP